MYTERQDQIIKYLADVKFAKIEQLAKEFDGPHVSRQRDRRRTSKSRLHSRALPVRNANRKLPA